MSRQILFNNNVEVPAAAAGTTSPTDVAEGRVAAFNADDFSTGTLNLAAAVPDGVENVIFVQGAKEGESPIMTSVIPVKDVKRVTPVAYSAPVAQVSTVVPVIGEGEVIVKVIESSAGYKPHKRISASVILDGKTKAQITDELVGLINKQYPKFVTASNVSNDLTLTGDMGVSFETAIDGQDWAITATAPSFGTGTPAQVKEMEEIAFGQQANFLNRNYLPINPPSYSENTPYDLHTFQVNTNTTRNIGGLGQKYQEITVAVTNPTTALNFDLETFFGV